MPYSKYSGDVEHRGDWHGGAGGEADAVWSLLHLGACCQKQGDYSLSLISCFKCLFGSLVWIRIYGEPAIFCWCNISKVEGGLELGCWKEFSRARDLAPSGTQVNKPYHNYFIIDKGKWPESCLYDQVWPASAMSRPTMMTHEKSTPPGQIHHSGPNDYFGRGEEQALRGRWTPAQAPVNLSYQLFWFFNNSMVESGDVCHDSWCMLKVFNIVMDW